MEEVLDILAGIVFGVLGRSSLGARSKKGEEGATVIAHRFFAAAAVVDLAQELSEAALPGGASISPPLGS